MPSSRVHPTGLPSTRKLAPIQGARDLSNNIVSNGSTPLPEIGNAAFHKPIIAPPSTTEPPFDIQPTETATVLPGKGASNLIELEASKNDDSDEKSNSEGSESSQGPLCLDGPPCCTVQ